MTQKTPESREAAVIIQPRRSAGIGGTFVFSLYPCILVGSAFLAGYRIGFAIGKMQRKKQTAYLSKSSAIYLHNLRSQSSSVIPPRFQYTCFQFHFKYETETFFFFRINGKLKIPCYIESISDMQARLVWITINGGGWLLSNGFIQLQEYGTTL